MIFSSFHYEFTRAATGSTADTFTIDMDFRSLYQISDQLVILGYASISGMRKDLGGNNINSAEAFACRLIGNFNETFNVVATIAVPRAGDSIALFSGIAFSDSAPFKAPLNAKILMPPTFQIEIDPTGSLQVAVGDNVIINCTIGYEIIMKNPRN